MTSGQAPAQPERADSESVQRKEFTADNRDRVLPDGRGGFVLDGVPLRLEQP